MMRVIVSVVIVGVAVLLMSCASGLRGGAEARQPGEVIAKGTVTQLSGSHGNAYTDIRADRYESLGLKAGDWVHVAFANTALTMVVGEDYTDVPSGQTLAVLHREGLTFAICDGNFSQTYGVDVGATFTVSAANVPR